ncbi:MAG: hypothetical protein ABIL20_09330, partial [candidate division WOR-3 bacterium]
IDSAANYLRKIMQKANIKQLVIDHHLPRDLNWQSFVENLKSTNSSTVIQSAAKFRGEQEDLLEAKRKDFYDGKIPFVNNYG